MKQTAVEWLHHQTTKKSVNDPSNNVLDILTKAKETENQQIDDFAIELLIWLTNEESKFSIMYGNQEKRFATIEKDYTTKELLEIFKIVKGL